MKAEPAGGGYDSGTSERPMTQLHSRLAMDTFTGFDIDHKHTLACLLQAGQPDRYRKLRTDVRQLREQPKIRRGAQEPSRPPLLAQASCACHVPYSTFLGPVC